MYIPTPKLLLALIIHGSLIDSLVTASPGHGYERGYLDVRNEESRRALSARKAPKRLTSNYTFNAKSSRNLAVYFGVSDRYILNTSLFSQCNNTNVDIVILSFITSIIGGGGYPDLSFDTFCSGQTAKMVSVGATGLMLCSSLAAQISQCQALGKKVLLSIGGANGNTTFSSSAAAKGAAAMMWNCFGGGAGINSDLRPFGNVKVDGFDIDNESQVGSYYPDFAKALRARFKSQNSKTYYLSASVECYYPSLSSPLEMLQLVDWVWPQFYGAPSCNIGTNGFSASFTAWSKRLSGPKLYIGAVSYAAGTTNAGYQDAASFATTIAMARKLASSASNNFGGVTLWDGPYGDMNLNATGFDFIEITKDALEL